MNSTYRFNTMERIPPQERFNQHAASTSVPLEMLYEALSQMGEKPRGWEFKQLSGGFMNANFLATNERRQFILRVYSSDLVVAQKESDLLYFLREKSVSAPNVFALFDVQKRPVMVMEYLDGVTLEERLLNGAPLNPSIYEKIGRALGEIHNVRFQRAGFIGPRVSVGAGYDNFTAFIGGFVDRTLRDLERRPDKLPLEMNRRFRKLFEDKWEIAVREERFPVLSHCDFNPKNILVSREGAEAEVVGVIDWEFSDAGSSMMDLGNFFRFAYDYPESAKDLFIRGYQSVNSSLPENWEEASRLVDLGAMCGFLERREDYQKSFRTARAVVNGTLEWFGY